MSKSKTSEQALLALPSPEPTPETGLKSWAMIELYGHQRIVGLITVDPPDFPGMIRVDVPDLMVGNSVARKGHTRYIGRNAIYAVNPCDEETVRNLLPHVDGLPSRPMTLSGRDW